MVNNGIQNELEIIDCLNGKKYNELTTFWQSRMKQLYFDIKEEDTIECYKNAKNQKADIVIKVDDKKWYISIKSGFFVSVHMESITSFTGFLRAIGIEEEHIKTLKLYHYGDGTTDGTGSEHKPVDILKEELKDRIKALNAAINEPERLKQIILRFIYCGTPFARSYVTHLYWGTKDYGNMIDVKTMVDYLCSDYPFESTSIHFGPFIYAPGYRGLTNFNSSNVRRYYINIKWPSLTRDIRDAKDWLLRNIK